MYRNLLYPVLSGKFCMKHLYSEKIFEDKLEVLFLSEMDVLCNILIDVNIYVNNFCSETLIS